MSSPTSFPLTAESLSILNSETSHLSVSNDDMDGCATLFLNLKMTNGSVASQLQRSASRPSWCPMWLYLVSRYPQELHNKEGLPLRVPGPWKEYPLCLNGRFVYGNPGPARVVVNPSVPDGHDVIYHTTRGNSGFLQAKYRPKGHGKGPLRKLVPQPSLPLPSPTLASSPPSPPNVYGTTWTNQGYYNAPAWPNYCTNYYLQSAVMAPNAMLQCYPGFQPLNISPLQFWPVV
ncbi:hypothetical protein NM208_g86 [Fusarium decemcellulare]|uniref:Uncharacterized protein n=1 Tax=Fusarium decemcellulare TaxID=57161 RepID=A0ACC1T1F0_9HYPO|nr:hypothetical protein NM208_g86 [Fusarium decemcellulare]